jgi:thiosulfate/3-mercaptopyruvate sulfurtransferase
MSESLALLIEPNELKSQLDKSSEHNKLLIIDLSREAVYQQAHVPGAIFLDFKELLSGIQPAAGKLPSAEQLSTLFSNLGLEQDSHVVAYDDEGGGWAGRFIWTLDCIGHKHYSYLNGGIHAWIADQMPIEQTINQAAPNNYQISEESLQLNVKADMPFILDNLNNDDLTIWDARSKEEYEGSKAFAAKGGHIPGAKHYEWTSAMDKDNALRLRPLAQIESDLLSAGIDKNHIVVTHCQTHHRSGFTYLLGKILGFKDIRGYDGSWSEWGNDPNTPVEK